MYRLRYLSRVIIHIGSSKNIFSNKGVVKKLILCRYAFPTISVDIESRAASLPHVRDGGGGPPDHRNPGFAQTWYLKTWTRILLFNLKVTQ